MESHVLNIQARIAFLKQQLISPKEIKLENQKEVANGTDWVYPDTTV